MRERETFKQRLAVQAYATAERLAMRLPERVGRRVFAAAGALAYRLVPGARETVRRNLARVLGSPPRSPLVERATREAFRSYARYWHDTFLVRSLPNEEFMRRQAFQGHEHIVAALEAGRGAILALPHLGNWDAAGHWVHLAGHRITAVAEELKPRRMYELFHEHRRALGLGVVPLSGSRKVGEELLRLLSENVLIALVCDRDLKDTGVEVEMFGARRRMPAGPALLSLAAGSPLLPSAPYDTDEGWDCVIGPPLEVERTGNMREDVAALTQRLAAEFERSISAAPTQWHMFQPAWEPEGPGGVGRPGREAAGGGSGPPPRSEER